MVLIFSFINILFFNFFIFFIGIIGLLITRRNMIIILVCLEIILLAGILNFILFSIYLDDLLGQIFSFMILSVAAAESSLGLALLVLHYRHKSIVSIDSLSMLKG
jgi:NADH-quinone oxidoreductase subunit K